MWYGNRKYYYTGDHISNAPQSGFKRITFITGCALLFKPKLTGILTEKFFFGEEDLDFSFRQKIAGQKMACCFSSVIYHKISASFKKVNASFLGSLYIYYLSRLINNRQYSSSFMFIIKIIMNLGYSVLLMKFRYKIRLKQIYIMISTILKELSRIDNIDKDYCLKSLKEDFSHPVNWN
jgi:GT2 family glycosyltransferase